MHHNQVGSISGMQSWFITPKLFTELHYINKLRSEKYMIISDAEKASSWQKPNKLEIKRTSSTWKAIYTKKNTHSDLTVKNQTLFPYKMKQGCPLLPHLFNIFLEVLARAFGQEK